MKMEPEKYNLLKELLTSYYRTPIGDTQGCEGYSNKWMISMLILVNCFKVSYLYSFILNTLLPS